MKNSFFCMLERQSSPKCNVIIRFDDSLDLKQSLYETYRCLFDQKDWKLIAVEFKPNNFEDYGTQKEHEEKL